MAYRLTFLTVLPSPYQQELFRALDGSNRFRVQVYYYARSASDRSWSDRRLREFERVLSGRTLSWLGRSAHFNPGIIRILRRDKSDLVVVSDYSAPTAQLAMRYLNGAQRRWVFWGEAPGFRVRGPVGRWLRRRLQQPIIEGAAGVATTGNRAVEAYQELTANRIPVVNIPYACDLAPYRAAIGSRRQRGPEAPVTILFSGQLVYRKGADILIRAFASIADRAPLMRLVLLGDGPEHTRLAALVPPHITERVEFRGFVQPSGLPAEFAKADIFVLPSRHDGWGIVLNEALGAGLPIIASDKVGAAHDLVKSGINGFIVPNVNVEQLAQALLRLGQSSDLRDSFGRASSKFAEDWDLSRAVSRWSSLCETILASGLHR